MCTELVQMRRSKRLSPADLRTMCDGFIQTLGSDLNLRVFAATIIQYYQDAFNVDTNVNEIRPEVQTIMSGGWDRAWETQYEERGLQNFIDYLESLWIERKKHWKWGLPPSHSFCAAIVQSSCAGKSRLVYSYVTRYWHMLTLDSGLTSLRRF
jgi:hypothetical protein